MSHEICDDAKLLMQSTPIVIIRGHFDLTFCLREISMTEQSKRLIIVRCFMDLPCCLAYGGIPLKLLHAKIHYLSKIQQSAMET